MNHGDLVGRVMAGPGIRQRKGRKMIQGKKCSFQVLVDSRGEKDMFEVEVYLNETLSSQGIRLSCAPSRNQGSRGLTRYSLIFHIDKEVAKRGAGRKETETRYGMEEAMKQEAEGKDKRSIAREMGISLATYYRRRKKYMIASN